MHPVLCGGPAGGQMDASEIYELVYEATQAALADAQGGRDIRLSRRMYIERKPRELEWISGPWIKIPPLVPLSVQLP